MRNKRLIILLSIVGALVLIIIVCGATFLVRDVKAYSYYVDSPEEYDQKVISAAAIRKNSSMFFLDETVVKNRVENKYYNVEVINVERKFPDGVSINYVVYDRLFQYISGDKYYKCYSSCRIGEESDVPSSDCFIVRPKEGVSDKVGAFFQGENGHDRKLINKFIEYMRTTPEQRDSQIAARISFVDLTRDGYFYIRTAAGCSIEIHGTDDDFKGLLDGAWSIFVDPDPKLPIVKASGIIRAYVSKSGDEPQYKYTYSEKYDEQDYRKDYLKAE